jgi:hypothetical protein
MSTTPVPKQSISISGILQMLSIALNALTAIPVIGTDAALAGVFINIIQAGMKAYSGATGQPLDLSKIPLETPVP